MSSFLRFPGHPDLTRLAKNLNRRNALPAQQYDWQILNAYGLGEELENNLTRIYNHGMVDEQIINAFKNDEPVYKEMVVEFTASFSFQKPDKDDEEFNTMKCIRFRLLGDWYEMSLADFGYNLGLVGAHVPFDTYVTHLNNSTVDPQHFNVGTFWPTIGMVEYDSRNSRESHLRSPYIRLLHRYLTWTLLYHRQPEKLNVLQIKGLFYCFHRHHLWHVPLVMATLFDQSHKEKFDVLPGGQFVTQIALSLRILTDRIKDRLSSPLEVDIKGQNVFITSMILIRDGEGLRLYREGEQKPEDEAGPSNRGGHGRNQSEDQGQGSGYVPTPQYDNSLIHLQGHYMDSLAAMMLNMDMRAEVRHETPYPMPYPDHYRNDWGLPRPWDMRYQEYENMRGAAHEEENEGGDDEGN